MSYGYEQITKDHRPALNFALERLVGDAGIFSEVLLGRSLRPEFKLHEKYLDRNARLPKLKNETAKLNLGSGSNKETHLVVKNYIVDDIAGVQTGSYGDESVPANIGHRFFSEIELNRLIHYRLDRNIASNRFTNFDTWDKSMEMVAQKFASAVDNDFFALLEGLPTVTNTDLGLPGEVLKVESFPIIRNAMIKMRFPEFEAHSFIIESGQMARLQNGLNSYNFTGDSANSTLNSGTLKQTPTGFKLFSLPNHTPEPSGNKAVSYVIADNCIGYVVAQPLTLQTNIDKLKIGEQETYTWYAHYGMNIIDPRRGFRLVFDI